MSAGVTAGRFAENVVHFARLLRAAGLPVGTDRVRLALRAVELVGPAARQDLHDALLASLIVAKAASRKNAAAAL